MILFFFASVMEDEKKLLINRCFVFSLLNFSIYDRKGCVIIYVWFTTNNRGHDCIRWCHSCRFIRARWKNQTLTHAYMCATKQKNGKKYAQFFLPQMMLHDFFFLIQILSIEESLESTSDQNKTSRHQRNFSSKYRCNFVISKINSTDERKRSATNAANLRIHIVMCVLVFVCVCLC